MPQRHILIVEDDPSIRRLVSLVLSREGFRVATASDGLEALARLDGEDFDLIVLDLNMPVLDGPGFGRIYRKHGGRVPIVLLSAGADATMDVGIEACRPVGFLAKPFRVEALIDLVKGCL